MSTEQNETLGAEDSKWLGEYSQVHMNVFGTPLRVMDHGQARIFGTLMATNTLTSWLASPSIRWAMPIPSG